MKHFLLIYTTLCLVLNTEFAFAGPSATDLKNAAKTETIYSEKILTYYQWAALPEKKQAEYLVGLRELHRNWENHQKKFGLADAQLDPLSKWALINELLNPSSAFAKDDFKCDHNTFRLVPRFSNGSSTANRATVCATVPEDEDRWGGLLQRNYICFGSNANANKRFRNVLMLENCRLAWNQFEKNQKSRLNGDLLTSFNQEAEKMRGHFPGQMPPSETNDTATAGNSESSEATLSTCEAVTLECGATTGPGSSANLDKNKMRKLYHAELRELDSAPCAIGGFVSSLNGTKKCTPIRKITLGSTQLSCSRKQIMCSPILYGLSKDGSAICLDSSQSVTVECAVRANKEGNTPEKIANLLVTKDLPAEYPSFKTEDFAELWSKHQGNFNQLCTNKTARLDFFCNECKLMNRQITAINAKTGCANECGRIDDLKNCSFSSSKPPAARPGTN